MEIKDTVKLASPVYVAYATLMSALDNLKNHGIPHTGIIDKSLWDTRSGAVQGQLLIALRFLGLIDEHNRVQASLPPLAKATAEERKALLKPIIEDKYRSVISLGLATISQGQLQEEFRKFPISGSTLDRSIRFFVKACQECGIPISKRVSDKVRALPSGPRKTRRTNGHKPPEENDEREVLKGKYVGSWEEKLLEKFPAFDPSWSDDLKTKWFVGFKDLMDAKKD